LLDRHTQEKGEARVSVAIGHAAVTPLWKPRVLMPPGVEASPEKNEASAECARAASVLT
jgi:hypothetical protein